LMLFTRRRVYAYEGDYVRVPTPVLVNIDVTHIALESAVTKPAPARLEASIS
jgi:hypothetical protein